MTDAETPTPPEDRGTLNVCTVCKHAVMKGIGETANHARVCGHPREHVEVVPRLTEVERHVHEWHQMPNSEWFECRG